MRRFHPPWRERGVTLVELMVALVIGMMLTLAMFVVMNTAEGRKRTTTSTSDANQAGNYAMVLLDHWVRNAGNGFSKSASYSFGCTLNVYYGGTQILPTVSNAALPSPFGDVDAGTKGKFRLAPVLILPDQTRPGVSGQTSDVLVVMGGAAGTGGVPIDFSDSVFASATQFAAINNTAFAADDLVLLAKKEAATTGNSADCIVEQVTSAFAPTDLSIAVDGNYHSTDNGLDSFSNNSSAMVLGNVAKGRPPQFLVIGVGDNNTLFSYDLLNTAGDTTRTALARADGVFELHALYGIDKNCDGKISSDEWVSPNDTTYSVAALMSGSMQAVINRPVDAAARTAACATLTTANDYLQKILAVRVGLILRTSLPEKEAVSTQDITLFADLGTTLTRTRTLSAGEQHYRYRTADLTIPLRNPLMLP